MNVNWGGITHPENKRPSKFNTHTQNEDHYERRMLNIQIVYCVCVTRYLSLQVCLYAIFLCLPLNLNEQVSKWYAVIVTSTKKMQLFKQLSVFQKKKNVYKHEFCCCYSIWNRLNPPLSLLIIVNYLFVYRILSEVHRVSLKQPQITFTPLVIPAWYICEFCAQIPLHTVDFIDMAVTSQPMHKQRILYKK